MTTLPQDESATKVCVDQNGICWHVVGDGAPVCTQLSVAGYVAKLAQERVQLPLLRVISLPETVALVVAAYEILRPRGLRVQVASPQIVQDVPSVVTQLCLMRQCMRTAEQGGWRDIGDADVQGYRFTLAAANPATDKAALFQTHPLSHILGFVDDLDTISAAGLLAEIADPYRFVSPIAPQRTGAVFSFLGLFPTRRPINNKDLLRRRGLAINAWSGSKLDSARLHLPGHFLWRRFVRASSVEQGQLRATQLFVRLLYLTWLDLLRAGRVGPSGLLFSPIQLFGDKLTAEAFQQHCGLSAASI